jgi:hypothetical protein
MGATVTPVVAAAGTDTAGMIKPVVSDHLITHRSCLFAHHYWFALADWHLQNATIKQVRYADVHTI